MAYNLFNTKPLTQPVQAFDPTKSVFDPTKTVEENMKGGGTPRATDLAAAYNTDNAYRKLNQITDKGMNVDIPAGNTGAMPIVNPNSPTSGINALLSLYTSPEDEEKMRKASVANQRILALGDALRHIGNIYNTTKYAPSQTFNSPVAEEYARYERGKALRDAANQRYYSYQMAKEKQDAEQRRWEQDFGIKVANAASQDAYRRGQLGLRAQSVANDKAYKDSNLARMRENDAFNRQYKTNQQKEQQRHNRVTEGQGAARVSDQRRRTDAYVNRQNGGGNGNIAGFATQNGLLTPTSRNYTNQVRQLYAFATQQGLIDSGPLPSYLSGNQRDSEMQNKVAELLMTNAAFANYAHDRYGWTYSDQGGQIHDWNPYSGGVSDDDDIEYWNDEDE